MPFYLVNSRYSERPSSAEPSAKLYRGNDFPDLDLTADEIAFLNSEVIQVPKIDQNSPGPSSSKSTSPIRQSLIIISTQMLILKIICPKRCMFAKAFCPVRQTLKSVF